MTSAVLYGGADGFEGELSDIDFAVDYSSFPHLPLLVDEYCTLVGWRLCQILRHETTAAYFVCSASDDASCSVALDACSDYQRNGTVFLSVDELLRNRQLLDWGGHSLSLATELRYRFAKAAAKKKDVATAVKEFAQYPEVVRRSCASWIDERWAVCLGSWHAEDLAVALDKVRTQANSCPSLFQTGALSRIVSRILHPTGLVVIAGNKFDTTAARLEGVFSHLYFRRFKKIYRWQPKLYKDLVSSTLIVLPKLGSFWSRVLPPDCIYQMGENDDCKAIAEHLYQRCKQREFSEGRL